MGISKWVAIGERNRSPWDSIKNCWHIFCYFVAVWVCWRVFSYRFGAVANSSRQLSANWQDRCASRCRCHVLLYFRSNSVENGNAFIGLWEIWSRVDWRSTFVLRDFHRRNIPSSVGCISHNTLWYEENICINFYLWDSKYIFFSYGVDTCDLFENGLDFIRYICMIICCARSLARGRIRGCGISMNSSKDWRLTEPCSKHWTLPQNVATPQPASASSVPDGRC